MNATRFDKIAQNYPKLSIAVIGDFCLDRYLEIDPGKPEISIETNLPVHNVVNIRSQPGAAGTILNNLVALGVGKIFAVGFCGEDGEGWELRRALQNMPGVVLDYFIPTGSRRTFTYTKPLLVEAGKAPVELNRLDIKNWSPTPPALVEFLQQGAVHLAQHVDAFILMDQVGLPETGVITAQFLRTIGKIAERRPDLLILADSRRGLREYPKVTFKMNATELAQISQSQPLQSLDDVSRLTAQLAAHQGNPVFVTLADQGIVGASANGETHHLTALPLRGEIDIVGAGDAVTANLASALSAGATLPESLQIAMTAASVVIHKLGTTGTASPLEIRSLLEGMK